MSSLRGAESAVALKRQGDAAYKAFDFREATGRYAAALALRALSVEDEAVLHTNLAAVKLCRDGLELEALSDAESAIALDPLYMKAHFRRGQALRRLGN